MVKRWILCAAVTACNTFEPEEIVIDTRVLAMSATVPDQVVDVDLSMGAPTASDLLDQLVPTTMCALVGDPTFDRRLRYKMTLCLRCSDGCCGAPQTPLAAGFLDDPELTVPEPQLCATIEPDGNLLGTVVAALDGDVLHGLGGVDYAVVLEVGGEGEDPKLDQIAAKTLRVLPRIPAARTSNHNPTLDHFDAAPADQDGNTDNPVPLSLGRCVDQPNPLVLVPTQRVRITPIEPADARETYVLPTIDGKSQMFTESLTYQWLGTAGGFSAGTTGGPRDFAGNPAPLFSDYRAPRAEDLDGPTDISLWIIQRDERLGAVWYEACIRVVP